MGNARGRRDWGPPSAGNDTSTSTPNGFSFCRWRQIDDRGGNRYLAAIKLDAANVLCTRARSKKEDDVANLRSCGNAPIRGDRSAIVVHDE